MAKVIITGHKNPDTDSILSSIIAKEYLKTVLKIDAASCRAGEMNNESKFALAKFGVEAPLLIKSVKGDERVVLVDHNEKDQIADGIEFSQVERIIDHHKMNIETEKPIAIRVEPIGCTAALLAKMFKEAGKKISAKTAKLMIAGIISDTLLLTSPTTTEEDKKLLKELNKIAKLDINKFASEMFEAKSSLEGISINDIISLDYKNFEMGEYKVGIGTWETTSPAGVNEKKAEIMKALIEKKQKENLGYVFFMVVDILKQGCYMYIVGGEEKALAEKVFKGKIENDVMYLKGVVSRKKQVAPPISEMLTK